MDQQVAEIPLTRGLVALIDGEDVGRVIEHTWYVVDNGRGGLHATNRKAGRLHRFILKLTPDDPEVDHANGNGLDCRKSNLRFATRSQNNANRDRFVGLHTSKFRGVSRHKGKWRVAIRVNHKQIGLGRFDDEMEAAEAYDEAAIKHFGEFARLNFPREEVKC